MRRSASCPTFALGALLATFAPDRKDNCPRVKDPATGLCHNFAEARYDNNVGSATVIITDHPRRSGYGPLKNDKSTITKADEIEK